MPKLYPNQLLTRPLTVGSVWGLFIDTIISLSNRLHETSADSTNSARGNLHPMIRKNLTLLVTEKKCRESIQDICSFTTS